LLMRETRNAVPAQFTHESLSDFQREAPCLATNQPLVEGTETLGLQGGFCLRYLYAFCVFYNSFT
jgi:hypothetical protein